MYNYFVKFSFSFKRREWKKIIKAKTYKMTVKKIDDIEFAQNVSINVFFCYLFVFLSFRKSIKSRIIIIISNDKDDRCLFRMILNK